MNLARTIAAARAYRWRGFDLKARMALAVALLISVSLALAGWLYARHLSAVFEASLTDQQGATAERLAAEVGSKIEAQGHQLRLFAASLRGTPPGDGKSLRERLRALGEFNAYLDDFWIADADGHVTADFPRLDRRVGSSVADREYFIRLKAANAVTLSEPTVGRASGQPRVLLLAPIPGPNGEFAGAVVGVIRLLSPRFMGEFTNQHVGRTGHVGVVTRSGVLIAHPQAARIMEKIKDGRNPAMDRARAGFEGSATGVNSAGVELIYTSRRVAGTDWIAYTAYPTAEAYGGLYRAMRQIAAIVALLAVAGGLAAWFLMYRLLAPLTALDREVRRIAADPQANARIEVTSDGEIGDLTRSFNRMLAAQAEGEIARAAAYAQMQHTSTMFSALYEKSPLGLALLRIDGNFVRCNPAFQKLTGYTDEELAGLSEAAISGPESAAADAHARERLARDGTVAPYEKEYLSRDGVRIPVRVSAVAADIDGVTDCVWWIAEDITARRQMLNALRESESEARMLSAAASHTGNLVVIAGPDRRIEWVNDAFVRVTGYSREEAVGRIAGSFLQGPETDPATVAIMREAIRAQRPFSVEVVNYSKLGRPYWVAVECAPVFDHSGRLERFVAIELDITARKDAEKALRDSEEKHRRIFETAREVIWQFDGEGRITLLNPAWERLTGHTVDEALGRPFFEFMVPEQRPVARASLADIIDGSRQVFEELGCFLTKGGEARWFEIRAQSYRDSAGAAHCIGTLHDVHDRRSAEAARRAAEDALRETQERYQRAIEGANDAIWERDLVTGKFYVSERIRDILALGSETTAETIDGVFERVHPDDIASQKRNVAAMIACNETVTWESRFRTGAGEYRWLRIRGRTVRDGAGRAIITSGTASDVHDARKASEELRAMQVRYARALEGASDGIWERAIASDEFYFSDRFDEILGYKPGGMPRPRLAWLELLHPDDLARHQEGVEKMLRGQRATMWECRFRMANGEYRWLRMRGIALRDPAGKVFMTSGTASDVHQAKLAEEELKLHRDHLASLVEERTAGLEQARREADAERLRAEAAREAAEEARMAAEWSCQEAERANMSKSEFLANMSHELRTPMHAIISFANFGVDKSERAERDKLLHYFRNIQKSGGRLLTLLNDLLDLSKLEAGKMTMQRQTAELRVLVDEAFAESEALARARGVTLRSGIPGSVAARFDLMRMLQVMRNLLSNAIKFSPEGGVVDVDCVMVAAEDAADRVCAVEIRVRDQGIGIPVAELEAVFDKFVQSSKTKTGAGGTGLGLAICREIVAAHGGAIHAENNPPPASGATFVVRLPIAEAAGRGADEPAGPGAAALAGADH